MSIINKMLQDLDRRQGRADPETAGAIPQVRSVGAPRKDREWFWRVIAVLMIAAVGWVAWLAWQLRPREALATELALKSAQSSPAKTQPIAAAPTPASAPGPAAAPAPVAAPAPAPVAAAHAEAPAKAADEPKPAPEKPAAVAETAAPATATPARKHAAAEKPAAKPARSAKFDLDIPPARILEAPAQTAGRVQKVDRTRSADDRAEAEFRRGAALLNQGRVSEAEESFAAAIAISPAHEPARQALVVLNLEQRRIDEARKLLQEGVALNPANVQFALVLARIHAGRREFPAALDVLNGIRGAAQGNMEYQYLMGTVLQRLGRHAEAVDAFRASLRGLPDSAPTWAGLGISLEAQNQRVEAIEAYKHVLAIAPAGSDLNNLAEQRLRGLR
jgi:MSHA biogenesis protein MshN